MKIVVTGSLGHISKPLTIALISKGHSVTVVSSKAERKIDIEALGAQAAIGSIEDVNFLTSVFTGADAVYAMLPPSDRSDKNFDPDAQTSRKAQNYKQAIKKSGVTKIIFLSTIGAHTHKGNGLLRWGYVAEKILNELPDQVAIKFMRPAGFYYNLLGFAKSIHTMSKGFVGAFMSLRYYGLGGFLSGKRGVMLSNAGGDTLNIMVSPLDIASVIAEEMEKPFKGRTFRYIASEELTCDETAKVLGAAIGKPYLKWGMITDKQLQDAMLKMGLNEAFVKGYVEMQAAGRKGGSGILYEDYLKHRPVLGKTKLTDYAPTFAKVYLENQ
jgi:uncharacterized protein YbjT (DUF2867 family)